MYATLVMWTLGACEAVICMFVLMVVSRLMCDLYLKLFKPGVISRFLQNDKEK
jgi:hypothetical protein